MSTDAKASLLGLRDIRGVEGSFLLLPDARIVARDALSMVTDAALAETGRRLANAYDALAAACPATDELLLRFDGTALFARRAPGVLLGVVASENVSLPALRMASNLLLRQLDAAQLAASAPAPPAAATPPAETKSAARFWRGTAVADET